MMTSNVKNAFLAFGLIALVLIFTPRYLKWLSPQPEVPPQQTGEILPGGAFERSIMEPRGLAAPVAPTQASKRSQETLPVPQWEERVVTIETPLYRAEVSSRGGGHLQTFELKNYRSGQGIGQVQLIPPTLLDATLRISYINLDGDSVYLVDNFEVMEAPRTEVVQLPEGEISLRYRYTFDSGASVTKRITFQADSYTLPVEISWEYPELEIGPSALEYEVSWPLGLLPAEKKIKEDETYGKVYVYQGGELEDQGTAGNGRVKREVFKGNTNWVAQRNKYFTAALIADPDHPGVYGAYSAEAVPIRADGNGPETLTRYHMSIGYQAGQTVAMTVYLGPLSYFIIKDLEVDLERIMNFGFALIRPISKFVLYSLVFLHKYIPNYGVVLILFALAVRVVTNPLTKKSSYSTQKMQMVQPQVKELQAKYKGNPQKLNKEMMALWKAEGVNPLGGCLPILIQMPLLWALFIVFRTTIELRGAPFALWITDLSAPDVIFTLPFSIPLYGDGVTVLALIMGVTMFVQQKLSGAASNPQQKPMMYMMTGMFFLIFNQFPSGLNLYYAFSNILAIVQQRRIHKSLMLSQPSPAPKKGPKKAKLAT